MVHCEDPFNLSKLDSLTVTNIRYSIGLSDIIRAWIALTIATDVIQ